MIAHLRGLLLACILTSMAGCNSAQEAAPTQLATEAAGTKTYLPFDCGMGTCFVTEVKSIEAVGQNANGKLFKAVLQGGEISDEFVSGEMLQPDKITYGTGSTKHVFCSTTMPMVIFERDGTYEANLLPFGGFIDHSKLSSANLYGLVCHPGEKWESNDFAQRHGYAFGIGDSMQLTLAKPSDILSVSPPKKENGPLTLSKLEDTDWDVLDTGCSCSFTAGKNVVLALGHNAAIFRTSDGPRVCTPDVDPFEKVYNGSVSLDCGKIKIQVSEGQGKVSNGDGYDAKSDLSVTDEGKKANVSGELNCMC